MTKPLETLTDFQNYRWADGNVQRLESHRRPRTTGAGVNNPGELLDETGGYILQETLKFIYLEGIKV